jgi:hypothetical protein
MRLRIVGLGLATLLASGSQAQSEAPVKADATTLGLYWIAGRFTMPVTCQLADGATVDVEEAVAIKPAPEAGSAAFKATFFGIDVTDARRCYNLVLKDLPDRRGVFYFTLRSLNRADFGMRDFRQMLEDGTLDYHVQRGSLRIRAVGAPEAEAQVVDFSGGRGSFLVRVLTPSSDGWRLLSRYRGQPVPAADKRRRLEFNLAREDQPALHGYYLETASR